MNHIPFTLLAYFFNALSVLTSKFLLQKSTYNPLAYVYYISLFSLPAIFTLPFTKIPSIEVFIQASISTIFWTLGAYFMFKALKSGNISRVIPVIGTLISLILLLFAWQNQTITYLQTFAVWFLVAGFVFLTLTDWKGNLSKKELLFEVLSAAFFAISYIMLREAYTKLDFISVLAWSRLVLLPFVILILAIPGFKEKVLHPNNAKVNFFSKHGLLFLSGQAFGAISEILLLFSISLANPALVNSLQGTQYVFLLFFALFLAKKYPGIFEEKYPFKTLILKFAGIALIGTGLYLMAFP